MKARPLAPQLRRWSLSGSSVRPGHVESSEAKATISGPWRVVPRGGRGRWPGGSTKLQTATNYRVDGRRPLVLGSRGRSIAFFLELVQPDSETGNIDSEWGEHWKVLALFCLIPSCPGEPGSPEASGTLVSSLRRCNFDFDGSPPCPPRPICCCLWSRANRWQTAAHRRPKECRSG